MDMTAISAIGNSLNVALNISKALLSVRDQAMIQEKVVELTGHIISAQQSAIAAITAQLELQERVRGLEEELVKEKTWETEKERYQLKCLETGVFVYALKRAMSNGEPPHWICATCYERGQRHILQYRFGNQVGPDFRMNLWTCPVCMVTIRTVNLIVPTFDGEIDRKDA